MVEIDALLKLERSKVQELATLDDEMEGLESRLQDLRLLSDRLRADLQSIKSVMKMLGNSEHSCNQGMNAEAELQSDIDQSEESPEDWLYPEYKAMQLAEAAKVVLERSYPESLSNSEVTDLLYDVEEGSDRFVRARNSAAASLRRGADAGMFCKVGRGYFQAHEPQHFAAQKPHEGITLSVPKLVHCENIVAEEDAVW